VRSSWQTVVSVQIAIIKWPAIFSGGTTLSRHAQYRLAEGARFFSRHPRAADDFAGLQGLVASIISLLLTASRHDEYASMKGLLRRGINLSVVGQFEFN
jgi:hypothetical protein